VKAGGAKQVLPLNEVAEAIQNLVSD
jgi:hypothetical protein